MDDGFGDFIRVAFVLFVGGAVIPGLCNLLLGSGPVILPGLVVCAVIWILWHVYAGLAG